MFRLRAPRRSVTIEIITLNPIMLGHCEHCEILMKGFGIDYKPGQLAEYPEELLELSARVTRFINEVTRVVYARVYIIEALSLRGLAKMIQYRGGRLPIIAVNGKKVVSGAQWDPEHLARAVIRDIAGP